MSTRTASYRLRSNVSVVSYLDVVYPIFVKATSDEACRGSDLLAQQKLWGRSFSTKQVIVRNHLHTKNPLYEAHVGKGLVMLR